MVTVEFDRSRERYIISVTGHADCGPKGQDTVCAAVSILTFALYRAARELDGRGAIHGFYHSISSGEAVFDFAVCDGFQNEVASAVDALFQGFYLLEENYPEAVRVV